MFLPNLLRRAPAELTTAGQYTLKHKIAQGGMGEVWIADHNLLARRAAVKLIRSRKRENGGNGGARRTHELFVREAQAIASLRSPHTVELYEFGLTRAGHYYYAMEYLEDLDLDRLINEHGPLPAERVVFLLQQVCSSLHEAHRSGLVHGDIKPANILCCCMGGSYDFVKVLDFGLVKSDRSQDLSNEPTLDAVTPGTPAFMPPEIALGGEQIDGRADIYALGCVGYFLLTGTPVFMADTPVATVVQHVQKRPEPPSLRTEMVIPEALERIILQCLEKNVEDRFQSAEELSWALAAVPLRRSWDNARAADWWQLNEPETGRPDRKIALSTADVLVRNGPSDDVDQNTASHGHSPTAKGVSAASPLANHPPSRIAPSLSMVQYSK